jgi:lycopene cyclase-like protein
VLSSLLTSLFGLTEPIFVPAYWNPPSLFDLAQRTGFDLESLIFCFGIGGVGAVLYNALTKKHLMPMNMHDRNNLRHRFHRLALVSPFIVFVALYFLPWNPIYPGIAAMLVGGMSCVLCRPDLAKNTLIGGALFTAFYLFFLALLEIMAPGYIARVWNLSALSGVMLGAFPIEELLFGFGIGTYWSGVYEHITWHRSN